MEGSKRSSRKYQRWKSRLLLYTNGRRAHPAFAHRHEVAREQCQRKYQLKR